MINYSCKIDFWYLKLCDFFISEQMDKVFGQLDFFKIVDKW